ncbi:hypothetical protein [Methylobacterium thuringiense]|uniref:Pectate lyase superfamily protein domain-containing protein n=1 Tax=Methylobacterium thuringiense TaxID=1003091 RepID=A0ABQ4TN89_9HYPH|nr:hypothetical protein [Methylobacterium thuringiense]GJE55567.1 hypothetical protein EKPJFOCH_2061 [Methylobacterium thuringiense]
MLAKRLFCAAAAAFSAVLPLHADQVLDRARIDNGGNVTLPGGPKLEKWQAGKFNATPDLLTLPSTDQGSTGNLSGMSVTLPSGVSRSLASKLGERKSIADYVLPADNGDYAPAIERAAFAGVTDLILPAGPQYTLKRAFNLPNADMRITCEGRKNTEIRLLGANDYFGVIGNTTSVSYNFYMDGCLFTKELASSSGAVLKIQNVYKWGFSHHRIFGDNKIWRVLELVSVSSMISRDVDVDSVRERAVYATAGNGLPGTLNGYNIDHVYDLWYVIGANGVSADPANDGVFYFVDNFAAIWFLGPKIASHKGYGIYLKGTLANRSINTLNLVHNPNIEAGLVPSASVYFGAVAASHIGGPSSWSTGKGAGLASIRLGPDSQGNFVRQIQLGVAGAGYGVFDEGTLNTVEDMDLIGYDAAADTGLVIGASARKGRYRRNKVAQFTRAILDASPDNAGHVIEGLDYTGITGTPLTGLAGSATSNKIVNGINNLDASAPTLPAAATLSLPDKGSTFTITTAGTINGITPTYIGRRATLLLAQSGTTLNDQQSAGGTGAFYLSKPLTTTDGKTRVTVEWRGDYWWDVSRTP